MPTIGEVFSELLRRQEGTGGSDPEEQDKPGTFGDISRQIYETQVLITQLNDKTPKTEQDVKELEKLRAKLQELILIREDARKKGQPQT